ncbi:alpha-ribazole phosphatase [Reticulibacter mediterranei]|uniref:Alpha-ribazole phosphatase n=1 Tax=Reticulibacter mediterranei TaxID=2778369 RepID=A0A8J3N1N1_9CHLR|nr:histidine phosphatase family protein [Reticulibacter mediterranei]GHO95289.1 alpha-ribazole phosphatase [Reticulibacter mediterranei]
MEFDKTFSTRRLWLVRHGATLWNSEQRFGGHSDIALSEQGYEQARWLAEFLRAAPIGTIYASDLLRARQTAEVIAQSHPLVSIQTLEAWRELNFGVWEGLTYAQIAERFPDRLAFFTDPLHASPPAGEAFSSLLQRVQTAFLVLVHDAARQTDQQGDIVLVSHGGPLRALLCCILRMPLERQWQLRLNPGSVSAVEFLPTTDEMIPDATLTLLNVQSPHCLNDYVT